MHEKTLKSASFNPFAAAMQQTVIDKIIAIVPDKTIDKTLPVSRLSMSQPSSSWIRKLNAFIVLN